MSDAPTGWEAYLEPGERVLWQERPSGLVSFRGMDTVKLIPGIFFLGFSIFWTIGAATVAFGSGHVLGILFPLFGVPFILVGLRLTGATAFWRAWLRRHSWYSLTSRRAFVATELFGRRNLKTWPITLASVLDLEEGPPDSIWFADGPAWRGKQRIGFEMISNGREVLHLMRQVQRGTA